LNVIKQGTVLSPYGRSKPLPYGVIMYLTPVGDNARIVPVETAGKRRDSSPCGFRMTGCLYVILSIAKDLSFRITYGVLQTVCGNSRIMGNS